MILFDKVPIAHYITNLWHWDVDWEEENPEYRCFIRLAHVVNAAKVLLIVEILIIPIYVLFLFPWWIFWIGPHFVIILLTLYALKQEKHRWMWPINLYAAFQFALWALVTLFKLIIAIFDTDAYLRFYGQSHHEDFLTRAIIIAIVKAIVLLIGAALFWRLASIERRFQICLPYPPNAFEGRVSTVEKLVEQMKQNRPELLKWSRTRALQLVFHTTRRYFEAKADGAVPVDEATGMEKLMKPI